MDREIVEQKLESLRRCVQRIEAKTPVEATVLAADFDMQDIVSLNLSRAVQLCVDIGAHLIAGMDVPPPATASLPALDFSSTDRDDPVQFFTRRLEDSWWYLFPGMWSGTPAAPGK